MNKASPDTYTCFDGHRHLASGPLPTVALALKRAVESATPGPLLIFSDDSGRSVDIDTRGSDQDVLARLTPGESAAGHQEKPAAANGPGENTATAEPRGRGRPKLGVVAREVTLLPRHWEWLASQSGGASVALRKLVEQARRAGADKDRTRQAHERAYHFMSAIAGDLPSFEEATRALFADDQARFSELIAGWPGDVAKHAGWLAFGDVQAVQSTGQA